MEHSKNVMVQFRALMSVTTSDPGVFHDRASKHPLLPLMLLLLLLRPDLVSSLLLLLLLLLPLDTKRLEPSLGSVSDAGTLASAA